MAHAVLAGEIDSRGAGGFLCHESIEGCIRAVGQKYRAGLSIQRFDMTDAIVLLVHAGQLMFFDEVLQVFLAAGGGDQSDLRVLAHDLAIEIKGGLRILLQRPLRNELREIFPSLGVDLRRIEISARREIDFRLADAQEAQGISRSHVPRLV